MEFQLVVICIDGYLDKLDLYLGIKNIEENLGGEVVLKLTENLKQSYCTVYFDNFFSSPIYDKLFDKKHLFSCDSKKWQETDPTNEN